MPGKKKNFHLYNFHGVGTPFVPALWPSAKTYYEKNGKYPEKYNWILPKCEFLDDVEKIKDYIRQNPPDLFGVGLYVWNFELSLEVCKWVKEEFPNCLVISGGPNQYFKHRKDWFVRHHFIDASLPSEVYGELAITDILDELADDNTIDWNKVEQMVYPLSFDKTCCLQSPKSTYKRHFKWDFSAYYEQRELIDQYVKSFYEENEKASKLPVLSWKVETTRGCPYACTFCDWGGGVGSKTIVKDIEYVKQDIDMFMKYGNATIYICDANFGICGERDLEIVKYIAAKKKESQNPIDLHYGGYAKTHKHFDILKQIFIVEAENNLSTYYKISVQTFDAKTLENIKRTDLRKEEHWELSEFLQSKYGYDSHVELIIGLPGITVDKWCDEFTIPYERDASVRVYEWHLLPESEAFDIKYREKFGLGTSKKLMNNSEWHIPAEIVVETNTYTRKDYIDMWIIYSAYLLFYRGGIYKKTIKNILQKNNITFGKFLKKFYTECYPRMKSQSVDSFKSFEEHLEYVVDDQINDYRYTLQYKIKNKETQPILYIVFFLIEYYTNFNSMDKILSEWLLELGGDEKLIKKESLLILNDERINKTKFTWFNVISYNKYKKFSDFIDELSLYTSYKTDALRASSLL